MPENLRAFFFGKIGGFGLLMLARIGFGLLMFAGIDGVLGFTDGGKI